MAAVAGPCKIVELLLLLLLLLFSCMVLDGSSLIWSYYEFYLKVHLSHPEWPVRARQRKRVGFRHRLFNSPPVPSANQTLAGRSLHRFTCELTGCGCVVVITKRVGSPRVWGKLARPIRIIVNCNIFLCRLEFNGHECTVTKRKSKKKSFCCDP